MSMNSSTINSQIGREKMADFRITKKPSQIFSKKQEMKKKVQFITEVEIKEKASDTKSNMDKKSVNVRSETRSNKSVGK